MGLLDKIGRVIRSNVGAVVSAAEDPEKILEQTVVDMQEDLVKLRQAVAGAIASQKRLEQQYNQAQTQANEWERRAELALRKGDENLAREALSRQQTFTETSASLKKQMDQSSGQVNTMRQRMTELESKISKYKVEKDMLKARASAAKATEKISQAMSEIDTASATGAFDRMKEKVLQMEARSEAVAELSGDSLEKQFVELEGDSTVELKLAALKSKMGLLPGSPSVQEALPIGKAEIVDAEVGAPNHSQVDKPPIQN